VCKERCCQVTVLTPDECHCVTFRFVEFFYKASLLFPPQSGSVSLIYVGSGFHCLRGFSISFVPPALCSQLQARPKPSFVCIRTCMETVH